MANMIKWNVYVYDDGTVSIYPVENMSNPLFASAYQFENGITEKEDIAA